MLDGLPHVMLCPISFPHHAYRILAVADVDGPCADYLQQTDLVSGHLLTTRFDLTDNLSGAGMIELK